MRRLLSFCLTAALLATVMSAGLTVVANDVETEEIPFESSENGSEVSEAIRESSADSSEEPSGETSAEPSDTSEKPSEDTSRQTPEEESEEGSQEAAEESSEEESREPTLGDVDGNGKINALDAARVLLSCVGKITLDKEAGDRADINADGTVNAADATRILLHIVGRKPIDGFIGENDPVEPVYEMGGVNLDMNGEKLPAGGEQLLEQYFTWRESEFAVAAAADVEAVTAPVVSDAVVDQHQKRIDGLKKMIARWDCVLCATSTDVRVDDVYQLDGYWVVCVYEFSWFSHWYEGYTTADTADRSGAGTRHVLRLSVKNSGITLASDACEDACTGLQTPLLNDDQEFVDYAGPVRYSIPVWEGVHPRQPSNTPVYCSSYDPEAAVAYCLKWMIPRNPAYRDYSVPDGNCANFASQCLLAGGLPTDGTWYSGSSTFISSTRLYRWLTQTANVGRSVTVIRQADAAGRTAAWGDETVPARELFLIGCPVFYRWGGGFAEDGTWRHTATCTGYLGDGTPAVSCNTTDYINFKWNFGSADTDYGTVQLYDPAG